MLMRISLGVAVVDVVMGLVLIGCGSAATYTPGPPSVERLVGILAASDPESPMYNPKSNESESFLFAITELAKLGPDAAPAAPILGRALRYSRHDSYMAATALTAIGADAKSAIPDLIIALQDDRADVRTCALFVLGAIGKPSTPTVPVIAPMLWDQDSFVRTAAAGALEEITEVDLVEDLYQLDLAHVCSVFSDEPDGSITETARNWWVEDGQHVDWTEQTAP